MTIKILVLTALATYKKPTARTAYLVFADTKANRLKNQKSYFLPTLKKIDKKK